MKNLIHRFRFLSVAVIALLMMFVLSACGNKPPPPDDGENGGNGGNGGGNGYEITSDAKILINQIFGGRRGNDDTPISHDFIEIYNTENITADISGWTLYLSTSRSGSFSGTLTFPAETIIPANHSFLIRGAVMTSSTALRTVSPVPLVLDITPSTKFGRRRMGYIIEVTE
jgi:hypothetical protein